MRLGIYGGTFDPIHVGHLILAEACREACALDVLWLVVAGSPPHKPGARTPVADRLEMARLAAAGNTAFEVSEVEAAGPGPHYSYQTLGEIAAQRPSDELFFLIGADSLLDLPNWRNPRKLASLATLVVANRQGFEVPEPPDLGPNAKPIIHVSIPPIGIASHDLRRRVAEGLSIRYQVPRGVEAYIRSQGLYRGA